MLILRRCWLPHDIEGRRCIAAEKDQEYLVDRNYPPWRIYEPVLPPQITPT